MSSSTHTAISGSSLSMTNHNRSITAGYGSNVTTLASSNNKRMITTSCNMSKDGDQCSTTDITPLPKDMKEQDVERGGGDPLHHSFSLSSRCDEPSSMKDSRMKDRKSYVTLCLLYIVYGISYSLLIPALPGLTLRLTEGDTGRSSMLYGTATSIRYALEFFSAPVLGSMADVKGRKFVFVLAFAVCACELLLLTFYPSIQMIFVTRAMSGLGDAGVASAYAMVTDIAMHNRDIVTQQYGLLGAMTGLAFIIGPYLGGRLMEIDMDLCFFVAAVIAIIGGVLSLLFLEETKPMLEEAEASGIVGHDDSVDRASANNNQNGDSCASRICINFNPLEGLKSHLTNPSLRVLLVPLALSAVNLGIPFIWYMYMHHTFHATASQIGLFLSFHGLMNAIAQGLFIRVVIPRFLSERSAAVYGLLVVALHTVCYGLCQETWQLFVVALIFCLSIIHYPALKAIVVCESLECRNEIRFQANLQGAISSIRTASIACGSILFTSLFSYGISLEPMPLQQLPFLVAGAIYVIAFFALVSALRSIDERRSQQSVLSNVCPPQVSSSGQGFRVFGSPSSSYKQMSTSENTSESAIPHHSSSSIAMTSYQQHPRYEYELIQLKAPNPAP